MLLVSKQSAVNKEFPFELVKLCKDSKSSIVRASQTQQHNNSMSCDVVKPLTLFEVENPVSGTLYDTFDIRNFAVDQTESYGTINSYVSLINSATNITMSADIIQMQDEEILAVLDPVQVANRNYLELNEGFKLDPNLIKSEIAALVYANWTNPDGSSEQLSMLCELNLTDERLKYEHQRPSTADQGVVIGSPLDMIKYKKLPADVNQDHIVIALYRMPDDMTGVNYVCGFGNDGYHPYIGIPAKGIFTMPSNYVPCMSGSYAPTAYCVVGPRKGGGKSVAGIIPEYTSSCGGMVFTALGNKLLYDMACNWGEVYNEGAGWLRSEFDYELKLKVTFQNTQDGSYKTYNPRISSVVDDKGATETIKPLYIMYGCLAAETNIKMASGDLMQISKIKIGDKVLGIDNDNWTVKNVWRGKEDSKMTKIVANYKTVLLTGNHPIATADGIKRADEIKMGMMVLSENGERREVTQVEQIEYSGEVFNLDLERKEKEKPEKHLMLADGFVVGDNIIQNSLEGRR
ncbi:MAG: hypothetical protein P4L69_02740 [Desulfosporosinus sp.]|nr:hypothetical protein [Desulfosporosinus sp.]